MYCTKCGNLVSDGLAFCNKCGNRVKQEKSGSGDAMSESSTNFLIAAMLGIPIAGIGVMIGLITVLKRELDMPNEMVGIIAIMGFILLFAAELGFLFLLLVRTHAQKKISLEQAASQAQLNDARTKSLAEAQFQNIATPVPSVTEHTTRTLDPVRKDN